MAFSQPKSLFNHFAGYLVIPLWILFFLFTSLILLGLSLNAWIARYLFSKSSAPDFEPRSIFPYEDETNQ
jgi:hypothetical protein